MHRPGKKSALLESLESRTLLSTTPLVMGYLVDFQIGNSSKTVFSENSSGTIVHDNLDWKDLKEVNYFSLLPNATPAFDKSDPTSTPEQNASSDSGLQATTDSGFNPATQLPAIVKDAKSHGASVYVTIGGGDPNAIYDMDALVNSPSVFGTFATNVKNFATKYGLAGVDLDWEPTAQDGFTVTSTQIENFGNLVKTIKQVDSSLKLTADALGDPVELSSSAGVDSGKSAFMLDAAAVQNLDEINVEAYPVGSLSESNTIMQNWATYVSSGKDLQGTTVGGHVNKLQYGIDISSDDSSNKPSGVIESKVDTTINKTYGGLFVFELDSDTGSPSVISRIGTEIVKKLGGTTTGGGSIAGTVSSTKGAGVGGVTVYLDANGNASFDPNELNTVTASNGTYSFSNVPAGAYVIRQKLPSGDTQTSPSNNFGVHITVTSTSKFTGENFTDSVSTTTTGGGSVSGTVKSTKGAGVGGIFVYLDANGNAQFDPGELNTMTASNGTYSFTNVPAAAYVIRQKLSVGDTQTSPSKNFGIHVTVTSTSKFTGENFTDSVSTTMSAAELTGKVFGSSNALNSAKSGHVAANAFDNSTSTTFEDSQANSNWVGLDLGKNFKITQIKYAADAANPSFMEGGVFQGSSSADFSSGVVNLFSVPNTSTPSTSLTTVNISNSGSFRYVRYLAPANSFGDVAEVDFFGTAA